MAATTSWEKFSRHKPAPAKVTYHRFAISIIARFALGIFTLLFIGIRTTLAQEGDTAAASSKPSVHMWTLSDLDTLTDRKWVWRDKSFKEIVPPLFDSAGPPDDMPELKKRAHIEYPEKAADLDIESSVTMRVLVDSKGKVRAAYVFAASENDSLGFEEAALDGAKKNEWEPARRGNSTLPVWVTYTQRFCLYATDDGTPIVRRAKWGWMVEGALFDTLVTFHPKDSTKNDIGQMDSAHGEKFPEMKNSAAPVYPKLALKNGVEGEVLIQVLVGSSGRPLYAKIVRPSTHPEYGFEESALKAALNCKWKAAEQDGRPVAVWVTYPIKFVVR